MQQKNNEIINFNTKPSVLSFASVVGKKES